MESMKTISNKYGALGLGVLSFVTALTLATPSGAAPLTSTVPTATCSRITTLKTTNEAAVATKIASMQSDFTTRLTNISNRQAGVDQKTATFRTNLASKFEAKVNQLESQEGLTPAQLKAIDVYKSNMLIAEATREATVDGARNTYRTSLATVVADHQQALKDAASTFQSSLRSAFSTAEAKCGDGTALSSLKTDVATARQEFKTDRESSKITGEIKQLAKTRNATIKTADEAFAQTAATYTATLVAILEVK